MTTIKLTDLNGAKEALPEPTMLIKDILSMKWVKDVSGLRDITNVHLEVDVEAMALELARAVFGLYAPNAKAIPAPLWIDYINFAKHLANNPNKWTRLVRK